MSQRSQWSGDSDKLLTLNFNATRRERKLKRFLNFRQMNERNSSDPLIGAPDLFIKIKNDNAHFHSFLLSVHCFEFSKWLERHKCNKLPASVDLSSTRVSKDGLRKMIEYIYDEGEIQMDATSVEATLIASSYFRMVGLRRLMEKYSLQLVAERTTFLPKWLEIADLNEVDPIYKNDLNYIASRDFQTLIKLKDAVRLSDAVMIDLLYREDLNICSEFELYEFVLRWLFANRDQEGRRRSFQILSALRFTTMSTSRKFKCLDMAEKVGLLDLVKPHIVMSDWQKTCEDYNHPYDYILTRRSRRNMYHQYDTDQRYPWSRESRFPKPMKLTRTPSGKEIFQPRSPSSHSKSRNRTDPALKKFQTRSDLRSLRTRSESDALLQRSESRSHQSKPVELRSQIGTQQQHETRSRQQPETRSHGRSVASPPSSQRLSCPSPSSAPPVKSPSGYRQSVSTSPSSQPRSVPSPIVRPLRPDSSWPAASRRRSVRSPAQNQVYLSKSNNKMLSSTIKKSSVYCKPEPKDVCFVSSLAEKDSKSGKTFDEERDIQVNVENNEEEEGNASKVAADSSDDEKDDDVDGIPLCLHITTKEVIQKTDGLVSSTYKRFDFRKAQDCCNHPDKWIPKPKIPK